MSVWDDALRTPPYVFHTLDPLSAMGTLRFHHIPYRKHDVITQHKAWVSDNNLLSLALGLQENTVRCVLPQHIFQEMF